MGTGKDWWVLVNSGGYWWILVGSVGIDRSIDFTIKRYPLPVFKQFSPATGHDSQPFVYFVIIVSDHGPADLMSTSQNS